MVCKLPFFTSTEGGSTSELSKSNSGSSAEQQLIINHSRSSGSSANSIKNRRGDGDFGENSHLLSNNHAHTLSQNHEDVDSDSRTISTGPENDENAFVADFSEFNEVNENAMIPKTNRLDYEQIQTQEKNNPIQPLYPQSAPSSQYTRPPDGQLVAMNPLSVSVNDGINGGVPGGAPSPMPMSYSSDFSISTNTEDNAYNALRMSVNNNLAPMLEHSAILSDDDESIRLNTIRKNDTMRENTSYLSNSESETEEPTGVNQENENGAYFSDSDREPESGKFLALGRL